MISNCRNKLDFVYRVKDVIRVEFFSFCFVVIVATRMQVRVFIAFFCGVLTQENIND